MANSTIKFWTEMTRVQAINALDKVMLGINSTGEAQYTNFADLKNAIGAISGAGFYPPVQPGGTLGNPSTISFTFLAPGSYNGGSLVVPDNTLGLGYWNGSSWSLTTIPLPQLAVVNNLTSTSITSALSANQGRVLNDSKEPSINKKNTINSSDTEFPTSKAVLNYGQTLVVGKENSTNKKTTVNQSDTEFPTSFAVIKYVSGIVREYEKLSNKKDVINVFDNPNYYPTNIAVTKYVDAKVRDFSNVKFGGTIDETKDLSKPTEKIWYFAQRGTYNTNPSITIDSDLAILSYDGNRWTYAELNIEVQKDFIVFNTIAELRDMSQVQIEYLRTGIPKGVIVNGYYEVNDTPAPIQYYITDSGVDDGGSTIVIGSLILKHDFVDSVNVVYFGMTSNKSCHTHIVSALEYCKDSGIEYLNLPNGEFYSELKIDFNYSNINVIGIGTVITYNYQQVNRTSTYGLERDQSFIVTPENSYVDNVMFKGLEIRYGGDYWIPNTTDKYSHSYGAISGMLIKKARNLILSGVTISGFNDCGVRFDQYDMPANFGDSEDVFIYNSSFNNNNFAGVFARNLNILKATSNTFGYNGTGMNEDMVGVTGYGLAFANYNGNYSKNLLIAGNTFIGNNRKGLDSHGCGDIDVNHNTFDGNRAFQAGLIYNTGSISFIGNILRNHLPLPTFSGKGTLAYASLDLGKPSTIAEQNFAKYNINIQDNIWKDIDVDIVGGEKMHVLRCTTDVKNLSLNISGNTIDADSVHTVFYLSNQRNTLDKNNRVSITNNIVNVKNRLTSTGVSIGGCEYILIAGNQFNLLNQGVSIDGTTVSSRDPLFISDMGVADMVKNVVVSSNIFNGTKRNGTSTTDFIEITDFADISNVNFLSKFMVVGNYINGNKSKFEYADFAVGSFYEKGIGVVTNPPSARLLATASSSTGAIVLKFPKQIISNSITDDKLVKVELDITNYNNDATFGNKSMKVLFSGRILKDGVSMPVWRSPQATIIDESRVPVQLNIKCGFDANSYPYIIIGEVSDNWRAMMALVKSVTLGLGVNQMQYYRSGYELTLKTDISAITVNQSVSIINPRANATESNIGLVKQATSLPVTATMEQLITAMKTAGLMAK